MTCRDCIHFNACYKMAMANNADEFNTMYAEKCGNFQDHSLWVKLPCKVGDTVWGVYTPKYPANPSDKGKWFMEQDGIQRILLGAKGLSLETWNMGTISAQKIGKTVFLTREDAERALQDRSGE